MEKKFDGVDKQQVDNAHNGHDERGPAKKESTTPPDFHRMMMVPDRILVKFILHKRSERSERSEVKRYQKQA